MTCRECHLIGIGDFSHGDNNIWDFRLELLKKAIRQTNKNIVIFNEDYPIHTNAIMDTKKKLSYYKGYGVSQDKFAWGPLEKYTIRSFDSPIYLKIIKYIRRHKDRIRMVGVDVPRLARDKAMADNILRELNPKNINFFWAHNGHIDNRLIPNYTRKFIEKEFPDEKYSTGYYLKKKLKDLYCIILSTGYEGKIRFNSICNNMDCDKRTFPETPFFQKFKIHQYKKYVNKSPYNMYKKFDKKIAEFADATLPDQPLMIKSDSWDFILFFSKVRPLKLST